MTFSVLRKCSANSSALSNKIDLIASQGGFVLIQRALEIDIAYDINTQLVDGSVMML